MAEPRPQRCYIALGANLGQPRRQLEAALGAIDALPGCRLRARSAWYRSRALGPGRQPDYLNGAAGIDTTLAPEPLLRALQAIEAAHGRVREGRERRTRWAARTLDLDILLYGDRAINLPGLHIPHPRMHERDFVLRPLLDIAPDLTLPCGTPVAALLAGCADTGLTLCADAADHLMPTDIPATAPTSSNSGGPACTAST